MPSPTADPDWAFSGLRLYAVSLDSRAAVLFGEFVNNGSQPKIPIHIRGTFYGAAGQVLDFQDSTAAWPIGVVPPGSRVPFRMSATLDPSEVATYRLEMQAQPTDAAPGQDFEFSGLQATPGANSYCLSGQVHHPGADLTREANLVVILYDNQNRVINFGLESADLQALAGGQWADFSACAPPLGVPVDHYDLRAWGW